jgi:hypothetical protein
VTLQSWQGDLSGHRALVTYSPVPDKDQDRWSLSPSRLVVADGATPLCGEDPHIVRSYAATLAERMAAGVSDDVEALSDAIAAAAGGVDADNSPSAGVCWLTLHADRLTVGALGDCVTLVATRDGEVHESRDVSLNRLDQVAIDTYRRALENGASSDEADAQVAPLLLAHRRMLGEPEGYQAARNDPAAASQARLSSFLLEDVLAVILLTDGASRLYDVFGLARSAAELCSQVINSPERARELLGLLREAEAADPELRMYPRLGMSDDALLASVDIAADHGAPHGHPGARP